MTRRPKIQIYRDRRGEWRWRLRAANGRILASGEGHARRSNARRAAWAMHVAALDALRPR